jgi:hypothetical protein
MGKKRRVGEENCIISSVVIFIIYCFGEYAKEDEIGVTFSTQWDDEKHIQRHSRKT